MINEFHGQWDVFPRSHTPFLSMDPLVEAFIPQEDFAKEILSHLTSSFFARKSYRVYARMLNLVASYRVSKWHVAALPSTTSFSPTTQCSFVRLAPPHV